MGKMVSKQVEAGKLFLFVSFSKTKGNYLVPSIWVTISAEDVRTRKNILFAY